MKRSTLLFALLCILCASCSKKSDNSTTTTTTAVDTMRYAVNNLSDVTVRQWNDSSMYMPVQLLYTSGVQEPVTISISGLPDGAAAVPASLSGTPTYTGTFTLNYRLSTAGTFPVKVTTTGSISGTKTFGFNIIVTAAPCSQALIGSYNEKNACNTDTSALTIRDIAAGTDAAHVVIGSPWGNLTGTVDCVAGTITVPETTLSSAPLIISGNATFTATLIIVNWHRKANFPPYTVTECRSTYTRI